MSEQIEHIKDALIQGVIDAAREFVDASHDPRGGRLIGVCNTCGLRWPCPTEVLTFAFEQYDDLMPREGE